MRRKELFYYVTWGSNVTRDVHWCVTVFYQQIENSNTANQIDGFTIDYGKFILKLDRNSDYIFSISFRKHRDEKKENNLLTLIFKMQILFARAITTYIRQQRASYVPPSSYTNTIFNQSARMLS